ncbi:MAG: adenosine deaminase [Pseudolysinimonas sp.]|uniref:adenosine deaminase n=1 Tax=Pseudolysinimonas sp. TaxID=2680009 RepID=UPI003263112C
MTTDAERLLPGTRVPLGKLPKISLHDHLDGGLRAQTIIDLAPAAGVELPADTAEALAAWFVASCSSGELVDYLKTFDITIAVMQSAENLTRIAREFVEDLAADGVIYGEIRWAPEQHLEKGLTLDQAVDAVQAGIDAAIDAIESDGGWIRAGQLVSAMRQNDRGMEIAELALRHRDSGAVGFDIAGPEKGFPPSRFSDAFDHLARECFPVTIHAGEADGLESIRSALVDGHALRLGHGVCIADDITLEDGDDESSYVSLGRLAQWVKDRGIPLETSPSSNLQTAAFTAWGEGMTGHPFDVLYQLGFRVTVNTDNRLMSGTSLTREIALLADAFGYDADDVETFMVTAAEAAFLPLEDREDLIERIISGFGNS